MPKTYRVQLVCPRLDYAKWVLFHDPNLSLTGILDTQFTFTCPVHGFQFEKPLQAEEKRDLLVEKIGCCVDECAESPLEFVNQRPFCRDHFIVVCQGQLDAYSQRLKEQQWRGLSFELVEQFIIDCMRGADQIEQGDKRLDDFQRAQLLNIIFLAAELGRHLRRSPRKALALPLRLISKAPQDSWEEDTETLLVSRCGALVRSHRAVKLEQQLTVFRKGMGGQTLARVAWCPHGSDARPVIAIEFLDRDNFWGMDWSGSPVKT
jgi:hypothetical protein